MKATALIAEDEPLLAQALQARMFQAAASLGGLDVQLVYFRGPNECRASNFVSGGEGLAALMAGISVRGGITQIGRVLSHALSQSRRAKIGALVFVGDAMEENIDSVLQKAGELGLAGVKAFMFQEGEDSQASRAFREIAREEAAKQSILLHEGIYAALLGPSYETPAEIEYLRRIGADLVGMSTAAEAIAARHMGMNVLAISCVTNMAAGILDQPLSHAEVMETGERVKGQFIALLRAVIPSIAAGLK